MHTHKCHEQWPPTLDMSYFYYCLQKIKTESHWFLTGVATRGTLTWVSSVGLQCRQQEASFISVTFCLLLLGVSCDFPEHDVEGFVSAACYAVRQVCVWHEHMTTGSLYRKEQRAHAG